MTQARAVVYTRNGGRRCSRSSSARCRSPAPGRCGCGSPLGGEPHRLEVAPARHAGQPVDPPQVPGPGRRRRRRRGRRGGRGRRWYGMRVWVWEAAYQRPHGTAQEYALVPARQAVLLPDAASFDLGAALGIPFLTAHRCLTVTEGGPDRLGPGALSGTDRAGGRRGGRRRQRGDPARPLGGRDGDHHREQPGQGAARGRGRRGPRRRTTGSRTSRTRSARSHRTAWTRSSRCRRRRTRRSTPRSWRGTGRWRCTRTTAATTSRCRCGR